MKINDEFVDYIKNITLEAAEILKKYFRSKDLIINFKSDETPVTQADTEADTLIREALKDGFPEFGIVTEESEKNFKEYTWLIDPLDGTKHFAKGEDRFHIMIGLLKDNKPIWGLTYNPTTNVFFYGGKEFGSFREDSKGKTKLEIKPVTETTLVIRHSKFAKEDMEKFGENLKLKKIFGKHDDNYEYKHILVFLATNEANLMFDKRQQAGPWDVCAPHAILEGAGGVVRDYYGNEIDYRNKDHKLLNGYCGADSIERINSLPWVHNIM